MLSHPARLSAFAAVFGSVCLFTLGASNAFAQLTDTDADGMPDSWEVKYGLNPLDPADAPQDPDGDHLTNFEEYDTTKTDPLKSDTDGDGMPDGWERLNSLDPNLAIDANGDPDSDGLANVEEYTRDTNPRNSDTDRDGLLDGVEVNTHGTNPTNSDTDGDGLSDGAEINTRGTDPKNSDTDGDGLSDGAEVNAYTTDPKKADTDGDGLNDGAEVNTHGTDPNNADTDSDGMPDKWEVDNNLDATTAADASLDADTDGLTNLREYELGTNPNNPDTDGDGMPDGWEVQYGLDPLANDAAGDFDDDGLNNLDEYTEDTIPDNPDSDCDILSDGAEVSTHGTKPLLKDTDGDGMTDYQELFVFVSDPLNPTEIPDTPFFREVGDPGNPDDDGGVDDIENAGRGYVGQAFEIAVTEVTNLMYARFLNAVARKGDALYGLYKQDMASNAQGGIIRTAAPPGSGFAFTYTVKPGFETKPVNFVSIWDALRYINWLHNGMLETQVQDATTTEDGVYPLRGTNPDNFTRHPAAKFFLPDIDEWHKAAYYDPEGGPAAQFYWNRANRTQGTQLQPSLAPFVEPVVGVGMASGDCFAGDYVGPSYYGTFDQDGSVEEWVQDRLILGGRQAKVMPGDRDDSEEIEKPYRGFRVARPAGGVVTPEPASKLLMVEVGEPFNLADEEYSPELGDPKLGAVNYTFQMGAYEVTNREYTEFLNAKAKEDSFYRLYDTRMESDAAGGIRRSGKNGAYVYTVKPGMALKPVVYVSIFSAMRYCNWLHNGGRTKLDTGVDMEAGAYRLLGNIPTNTDQLTRNATARFYLPNAEEFYKAAYYDSSAAANGTFNYWKFATRSDSFNTTNNSSSLANVDAISVSSWFGTYGQSGNVGYVNPGSGPNTPAPKPTAANTGELLEESANTDDESATKTFRIAAASGMVSLRPLGDEDGDGLSNGWEVLNELDHTSGTGDNGATGDPDKDGLLNSEEQTAKTDPKDGDTDIDGLTDFDELRVRFTNPKDADTDDDGLTDGAEVNTHKTDPNKADTDGEGLSDGAEVTTHGTNPTKPDTDGDGLSDFAEITSLGTNPTNPDTDGDGMNDGWEVQYSFDPKSPADASLDADSDGLTNLQEFTAGSDPKKTDTDGDGPPDKWEVDNNLDPANAADASLDADSDGLTNLREFELGTNPQNADTDGDVMPDGWEVQYALNPLVNDAGGDADSDGLTNLREFQLGTLPRDSDTDNDLISDGEEQDVRKTNPLLPDTDGDKLTDYQELFVFKTDPLAATSIPEVPFFTPVGDAQNPDDDGGLDDEQNAGRGYVGQEFEISVTEVSNEMYVLFLNSVAKRDRFYGLYKEDMGKEGTGGGIVRDGTDGTYTYTVKSGFETKPVNFVSLWDTLRYINWLHNWKVRDPLMRLENRPTLTGAQDQNAATTEDGVYALRGTNPDNFARHPGAHFFLPDVDEWHKAAYYDPTSAPGKPAESYWDRATQKMGTKLQASTTPLVAVGTASGDYFGPSHYGTYDQDGNVAEWVQNAVILGGGVTSTDNRERESLGFRVARPAGGVVTPEPASKLLMVEVGEPLNLADEEFAPKLGDPKLGAVNYTFQMGAYEVTNREYEKFLNAKAKEDSFYRLYDTRMGSDTANGGITRSGSNGNYSYKVKRGMGLKPVVYVSIYSAMRYCNWLHNGGRSETDTDVDMEDGAYRLLGNIPTNTKDLTRNATARYYLPNAGEFYKAAYYDPPYKGGVLDPKAAATFGYWKFATRSDTFNTTNNNAKLDDVDFSSMASYFGTYGQSGNVGYQSPGSGANTPAPSPTFTNTGEWLEAVSTNSYIESATTAFRIAAAAGMPSVRPDLDADSDGLSNGWEILNDINHLDPNGPNGAGGDPDGDGLLNSEEQTAKTDPKDSDTDIDGLTDFDELRVRFTNPKDADTDDDGLTDGAEVNTHKTDPNKADTDGEGLSDGAEVTTHGTSPINPDTDGDGLSDFAEITSLGTNPTNPDTDADGMPDGWEVQNGLNPKSASDKDGDPDLDVLSNLQEYGAKTNPRNPDTDGDGMPDGWEVLYALNPLSDDSAGDADSDGLNNSGEESKGTNPRNPDTDGDGMPDGWEVDYAFSPLFNDAALDNDGDTLPNLQEFLRGTNPRNSDTDGDGMPDGWEVKYGLNPLDPADAALDADGDGLNNSEEQSKRTDPRNPDTDGDGMPDGWEVLYNFSPALASDAADDGDLDSLTNLREFQLGTNPRDFDTDDDSMPDGWEVQYALNPKSNSDKDTDSDKDGLSNVREYQNGTLPNNKDTDKDGMSDGWEVQYSFDPKAASDAPLDADSDGLTNLQEFTAGSNPRDSDTDKDGMPDAWEVTYGLNPANAADAAQDADSDGLNNLQEFKTGTNPKVKDSDKDGMPDGWEVTYGLNPLVDDSAGDADGDGLTNLREFQLGTKPDNRDTDADRVEDGDEVNTHGTNPLVADTDNDGLSDYQELFVFGTNPVNSNSLPDVPSFVRVGNPGNPDEDIEGEDLENAGIGYVGGEFEIGITEVTNLMYAKFLNAVAKSDKLYGLYSAEMGSSPRGGIVRTGADGSYLYTVKSGFATRPVNYVSVYDAMRYCNWLHNGSPTTGVQNDTTTEDGAYKLTGDNPPEAIRRSFGAKFFLPDQDEWHKAAYYDPAGPSGTSNDYWFFADRSFRGPGGNFEAPRNKPAGTSSGPSHYGTFDQDGNVREWLDASLTGAGRLVAGGGCEVDEFDGDPSLILVTRNPIDSEDVLAEALDLGFRVARAVSPSPSTPDRVPAMVKIGLAGNPDDSDGKGRVTYDYLMGAYEVTNEEYAAFLNAAAKSDGLYGLYDTRMDTGLLGGIRRSGTDGSFSYSVKPGFGKRPVNYVTVFDAMRYCNWLHNGARSGADTETGAYRLLGNLPPDTARIRRNFGARYFLPNEDEWHKAAYYDPSTAAESTGNYWSFAVRTDNAAPSQIAVGGPSGLVDVNKPGLGSYFGTFGQSGNAAEWTEELSGGQRLVLGGGVASDWSNPSAAMSFYADASQGAMDRGFRIAARADSPSTRIMSQQTISFSKLPARRVIGAKPLKINLRAKASSKLAVEFQITDPEGIATLHGGANPYLLVTGAGRLTITARQTGGGQWGSAESSPQTIEIVPRQTRVRSR